MRPLGLFGPIAVVGSVVMLMGYGSFAQAQDNTAPNVSAALLSCSASERRIEAKIRVINLGTRTRTVRVHLDYIGKSGQKIGDSLAVFWSVPPGTSQEKVERAYPFNRAGARCSLAATDWSAGQ